MPTNTLTDHRCKSVKPGERPQKLFDGHGLYLFVTPAGAKVWRVSYRVGGKPQTATLGPYPLLGLADARAKRDDLRRKLLDGEPVKVQKRVGTTLREAGVEYWEGRKDTSESYRTNIRRALEMHVYPRLGGMDVADITRADALDVLKVMDAKGLHVYVRKVRVWWGQIMDWCVEHGKAPANVLKSIDPAKAFGSAPVESFASLGLHEVHDLIARLSHEAEIQSALACRLLGLTWVRTQELRMMEWSEVDGDIWRIPAGKMKRRRDHLVPLPRQAVLILEKMRQRATGSTYVFPSDRRQDRPMSENAILYLLHRMGYKGRMTGHGFRTVASTWANENGYGADAIERQLSHAPDDKVRATYNRAEYLPERRAMLQAWADWLLPDTSSSSPARTSVERCQ